MRFYRKSFLFFILAISCSHSKFSPIQAESNRARASLSKTMFNHKFKKSFTTPKVEPKHGYVSLRDTPEVRYFISYYLVNDGRHLRESLKRRAIYQPVIKKIFDKYGLPEELINLALLESGFNPKAKSPQGAVGLWQFIASTARNYGLRVSFFHDDRKDIEKSTDAAARHLIDLYETFRDWHLALVAYNLGEGGLKRAINSSGTRDCFEMSRNGLLNKETSQFLPKFIALTVILKRPEAFGLVVP